VTSPAELPAADAASEERRERRPRERGGRERRERNGDRQNETRESRASAEPADADADAAPSAASAPRASETEAAAPRSYFARRADADVPAGSDNQETPATPAAPVWQAPPPVEEPAVAVAAPTVAVVAAPAVAVAAPAAAAPAGLPKAAPFALPTDELARIADAAGLSWVNSDTDKVAAVQAAIAAEPQPIHVPRERAPAVALDDGPLVLVETRKHLPVTMPDLSL